MAIVLEEGRKFNWKGVITGTAVLAVIAAGLYFLFFAPVPGIEVIAPPAVQSAAELSAVQFDPASVVNSDDFRALRRYTGEPTVGQIGRVNPFVKY